MADMTYYIYLKPVSWSHQIKRYPTINVEGAQLAVRCRTLPNSDLLLSEGYRLRDFEIPLTIFQGELDAENRQRHQLSQQAIGGIWWIPEEAFVHGWFHLKADDFAAVWDQVRIGGYEACGISLGISPVEYTDESQFALSGNPSIEGVEIYFTRETVFKEAGKDNISEKIFRTPSKCWAVALFVISWMAWFFPWWLEPFFEASKGMTTGAGRIVAAVLFVGGLLLWFLGSSRSSVDDVRKRRPE